MSQVTLRIEKGHLDATDAHVVVYGSVIQSKPPGELLRKFSSFAVEFTDIFLPRG
jgi:hypothetical protein